MSTLASKGQLRASIFRWSLLTVPGCILLGFMSGQLGNPDSVWFEQLYKPEHFPPPTVFPLVWLALYVLIGFALALVCAAWGARGRRLALILFAVNFLLNIAWVPVFFGNYQLTGGLVVLGLVALTLVATIAAFWRVRALAGILLLPYLAWVGFAGFLNWELLELNPQSDGADPTRAVQRIEF